VPADRIPLQASNPAATGLFPENQGEKGEILKTQKQKISNKKSSHSGAPLFHSFMSNVGF
jgi:hypothetical protein